MATVSELFRSVGPDWAVRAGASGLGREVRRIMLARPTTELTASIGGGDLVVYAARGVKGEGDEAADRAVMILLGAGVAGVLSDLAPSDRVVQAADRKGIPVAVSSAGREPTQLYTLLVQALEQHQQAVGVLQTELHLDFARLANAGATPAMLVERLVEATGKTGILQAYENGIQVLRQPVLQDLEGALVRRAIHASDMAAQRWMTETADASVANVLYLELAADRLIRLLAPIWIDGEVRAAVSLCARSHELNGRDRLALVAAARAIAQAIAEVPHQVGTIIHDRPFGVVVVRAPDTRLDDVAEAAAVCFERPLSALTIGRHDVRVYLPYESQGRWGRQIAELHAHLTADLATAVTLGHAVHRGVESRDPQYTSVQAAEAALLGEDLFGPGHATGYAEAQLARFLLAQRQTHELHALYERAIGKLAAADVKRASELVTTLEAYCETVATQGAAERLGIHRNTMLYRLKLIEEITAVDLEDGPSRLFLQLGLLAGRLVRRADGGLPSATVALGGPRLVKVARRSKTGHARTA